MKAAQLFDVNGHVVLVTGAASGLGLAMAEVMAENGATVVLTDVDGEGLAKHTARLAAAGGKVHSEVLDVADRAAVERCVAATAQRRGRLDAVFANAGISAGPAGRQMATAWETWDKVLDINLTGVFATVRAAAEAMKPRRSGRIVVTASIAAFKGEGVSGYAYGATKAAVSNLVRRAAIELGPFNIMVNGIAPGPFRTNIAGGHMHTKPEIVQAMAAETAIGRIAEPGEIKGLALLLASPASSYMTGTVIPIDGGALA
jgi:NAD(P)-dependent dehydrogenase (short-subunit alcohol dehydrogenase family)